MCGRFVGFRSLEALKAFFPIDIADVTITATYNVAPGQKILAIVRENNINRLDYFHWGLVPFWAKDKSLGTRLINARSETIGEKPSFRNAFKGQRCLILSDGYERWLDSDNKKKDALTTLLNESIQDLKSFPVSRRVNRASNNDASNIESFEQMTLPFSKDT